MRPGVGLGGGRITSWGRCDRAPVPRRGRRSNESLRATGSEPRWLAARRSDRAPVAAAVRTTGTRSPSATIRASRASPAPSRPSASGCRRARRRPDRRAGRGSGRMSLAEPMRPMRSHGRGADFRVRVLRQLATAEVPPVGPMSSSAMSATSRGTRPFTPAATSGLDRLDGAEAAEAPCGGHRGRRVPDRREARSRSGTARVDPMSPSVKAAVARRHARWLCSRADLLVDGAARLEVGDDAFPRRSRS